jgi:hypothetical protein
LRAVNLSGTPKASATSSAFINEAMIPVVERLACHVEKRFGTLAGHDAECFKAALRDDMALARQLVGGPFWTPYNIDFRGKLNALPHFHIGREDRVRSLFMFRNGQPVSGSAYWIEIAVANAAGRKGPWRERHDWVADNSDLIRRVAADPFGTLRSGRTLATRSNSWPHVRNWLRLKAIQISPHVCLSFWMARRTGFST